MGLVSQLSKCPTNLKWFPSKGIIDEEINIILNKSYERALNILKTHEKELHSLAEALLTDETLDSFEVKAILELNLVGQWNF